MEKVRSALALMVWMVLHGTTASQNLQLASLPYEYDALEPYIDRETMKIPIGLREIVRNNGGGYVNHDMFWHILRPAGNGTEIPDSDLSIELVKTFESLVAFKNKFEESAKGIFGSGWTWLTFNTTSEELDIQSTSNQDTPLMQENLYPLLCLDVWEHAYYLQYRNDKPRYVEAFWNVVNWDEVLKRYQRARQMAQEQQLAKHSEL